MANNENFKSVLHSLLDQTQAADGTLTMFTQLNETLSDSAEDGQQEKIIQVIKKYLKLNDHNVRKAVIVFLSNCLEKKLFRGSDYLDLALTIVDFTYKLSIDNVENQELWLQAIRVILLFEDILKELTDMRTIEILSIFNKTIGSNIANAVQKTACLQRIKLIISNCDDIASFIENVILVVHENVLPLMFSANKSIQKAAVDLAYTVLPYLPATQTSSPHWETVWRNTLDRYPGEMIKLAKQNDCMYSKIWIFLIKMLGNQLHKSPSMINHFLSVIETAFKTLNTEVRKQAFFCWQALIENLATDPKELHIAKRTKLLMIPLKTNNCKSEELIRVKFDTWCMLINGISDRIRDYISDVLLPFLNFCFGPLCDSPLMSHMQNNSTVLSSPGKKFPGMHLICCKVFLKMIARREYVDNALYETTTELNIKEPIINAEVLEDHSKSVVFATCEASVLLALLEDGDKAEISTVLEAIWKSMFHLIDSLKSQSLKSRVCDHLAQGLTTTITLTRRKPILLQKCLVPITDTINSGLFRFLNEEFIIDVLLIPILTSLCKRNILLCESEALKILQKCVAYQRENTNFLTLMKNLLSKVLINAKEFSTPEKANAIVNVWLIFSEEYRMFLNSKKEYTIPDNEEICCTLLMWPMYPIQAQNEKTISEWQKLYNIYDQNSSPPVKMKLVNIIMNNILSLVQKQPELTHVAEFVHFIITNLNLEDGTEDSYRGVYNICNTLNMILSVPNLPSDSVKLYQECVSYLFTSCSESTYIATILPLLTVSVEKLTDIHKNFIVIVEVEKFLQKPHSHCKSEWSKLLALWKPFVGKYNLYQMSNANKNVLSESINTPKETNHTNKNEKEENTKPLKSSKEEKPVSSSATKTSEDSEYVFVNSPYKFDPKKLTKTQKERLSKRRDDIPALYQDLSQSQSISFLSNSESQTTDLKDTERKTANEKENRENQEKEENIMDVENDQNVIERPFAEVNLQSQSVDIIECTEEISPTNPVSIRVKRRRSTGFVSKYKKVESNSVFNYAGLELSTSQSAQFNDESKKYTENKNADNEDIQAPEGEEIVKEEEKKKKRLQNELNRIKMDVNDEVEYKNKNRRTRTGNIFSPFFPGRRTRSNTDCFPDIERPTKRSKISSKNIDETKPKHNKMDENNELDSDQNDQIIESSQEPSTLKPARVPVLYRLSASKGGEQIVVENESPKNANSKNESPKNENPKMDRTPGTISPEYQKNKSPDNKTSPNNKTDSNKMFVKWRRGKRKSSIALVDNVNKNNDNADNISTSSIESVTQNIPEKTEYSVADIGVNENRDNAENISKNSENVDILISSTESLAQKSNASSVKENQSKSGKRQSSIPFVSINKIGENLDNSAVSPDKLVTQKSDDVKIKESQNMIGKRRSLIGFVSVNKASENAELELVTQKADESSVNESVKNSDESFNTTAIATQDKETITLTSQILKDIDSETQELNADNTFDCRKALFNNSSDDSLIEEKKSETVTEGSPPRLSVDNKIVSSPVCSDTPTRNKELIKSTVAISPIKNLSNSSTNISNDSTILSFEMAVETLSNTVESSNKVPKAVTLSTETSPELFSSEPMSIALPVEESKEHSEVHSEETSFSLLSNAIPTPLLSRKRKPGFQGGRSAQMMNMLSAQSSFNSDKPKKTYENTSKNKITPHKSTEVFSSPATNRTKMMMSHRMVKMFEQRYDSHPEGKEEPKKQTPEEEKEERDKEIAEEDFLRFSRELPLPTASPRFSILRKRKQPDHEEEGMAPCAKRKRVNFCDPEISCRKFYEISSEFHEKQSDIAHKVKSKKRVSIGTKKQSNSESAENIENGIFDLEYNSNLIESCPIESNPIESNPIKSNPIESHQIESSNPIESNPIESNPIESNPIVFNLIYEETTKEVPKVPENVDSDSKTETSLNDCDIFEDLPLVSRMSDSNKASDFETPSSSKKRLSDNKKPSEKDAPSSSSKRISDNNKPSENDAPSGSRKRISDSNKPSENDSHSRYKICMSDSSKPSDNEAPSNSRMRKVKSITLKKYKKGSNEVSVITSQNTDDSVIKIQSNDSANEPNPIKQTPIRIESQPEPKTNLDILGSPNSSTSLETVSENQLSCPQTPVVTPVMTSVIANSPLRWSPREHLSPNSMKNGILDEEFGGRTLQNILKEAISTINQKKYDPKPLLQMLTSGVSNASHYLCDLVRVHHLAENQSWENIISDIIAKIGIYNLMKYLCRMKLDHKFMLETLLKSNSNDIGIDFICNQVDLQELRSYVTKKCDLSEIIPEYNPGRILQSLYDLAIEPEYAELKLIEILQEVSLNVLSNPGHISSMLTNLTIVEVGNTVINRMKEEADMNAFLANIYKRVTSETYLKPVPNKAITNGAIENIPSTVENIPSVDELRILELEKVQLSKDLSIRLFKYVVKDMTATELLDLMNAEIKKKL